MKYIDKIICNRCRRPGAGRTGTAMPTEMLEWRTEMRDLSTLVKKITDTRYNTREYVLFIMIRGSLLPVVGVYVPVLL